jgi:CubicO group peptidase (beta-lactamase class C family)
MFRLIAFLLSLVFTLSAADRFDGVRASIRKQLAETGVPSIAVAVARGSEILWEQGFGWADREKRVAATGHTMYSLASISKPVTATGLMLLVKDGKLDLDKPVNDYLANAKVRARVGDAAAATVRRVANHTSGLPTHAQFFWADVPYRPPSMDETILRFGSLVTPPGERYEYSNLGFGILDYVIARMSGKPYADFMRERVFVPLGLTRTSVYIGPGMKPYAATRYDLGGPGEALPLYEFDHPGASAVYASAHDLVRFGMFHLKAHLPDQKAILPDELIDAMQKPTAESGGKPVYGIGWAVNEIGGYRFVSHTGGMPGVATALRLVPSEKLAIVVLANAAHALPHRIADEIAAAVLPGWKAPAAAPGGPAPQFVPSKELTGKWKGKLVTYRGEKPFTLRVFESGDIHAQIEGQMKMLCNDVRWADDRLRGRMPGVLGIEEDARGNSFLQFFFKLRGNVLNGPVSSVSGGRRSAGTVTQWLELTKE